MSVPGTPKKPMIVERPLVAPTIPAPTKTPVEEPVKADTPESVPVRQR